LFCAYDAINYEREFCCFLSEGDVESDFNWFASVILFHFALFLLSVIYRIIFERRSMKVAGANESERERNNGWPHKKAARRA
jgi:hypothetical protein